MLLKNLSLFLRFILLLPTTNIFGNYYYSQQTFLEIIITPAHHFRELILLLQSLSEIITTPHPQSISEIIITRPQTFSEIITPHKHFRKLL